MAVTTLRTQLGLGSKFFHWFKEATSAPYDHLLIELLPGRDNRLSYCTNKGSP